MPRRLAGALALLTFGVLAVATLIPLWRAADWPINHDNAFGLRTYLYARHLSSFDLLPIWSSIDLTGFGSATPVLYHKLFFLLAGALALVTGSVKSADVTALALLLVAGAAGMYLTMRELGASRLAAAVAGCCLMAANYTVTNWLVRGAVAECSAAMIAPWALFYFARTLRSGRVAIGLGAALGLMWLGHSVLAFYAGLILAAAYLLLAVLRLAPWSVLNPRTAWPALLCFGLFVVPYLVPLVILGRAYDFTRILAEPYQPVYQFKPLMSYLWEQNWQWGRTALGLSIEIDHAVLLLPAAGLLVLAARKPEGGGARWGVVRPIVPFLIVAAIGCVLQMPMTGLFYEWVPGAVFIQFPWRLLALITPALIVAAVYLADKALPPEGRRFALGAVAAGMIVGCGAFAPLQDARIPMLQPLLSANVSGLREYEPRLGAPIEELRSKVPARWAEAGCGYERIDKGNEEVASVQFRASCGRGTVLPLPLPLYASPLHFVTSSNYSQSQPCLPLPDFPSLCAVTVPAADSVITVKLPTMASIPRWAWLRLRGTR